MRNNGKHLAAVAVLVVLATAIVYPILSAIYQLPAAASAEAGPIDQMFRAHFFLIAFLFSLIMVFMLYSVFVFRRKPDDEEEGPYVHGHTGLEITWTVVPLITVVAFGVWGAVMLNDLTSEKDNEMAVEVIGYRWFWEFGYPEYDEVGMVRELVLPVNQPIRLEMTTPDVIHSFWVPEFRVKQDLVPGHTTILRVTPTEIGEYKLLCAEICGFGHADMRADVRVVSQAEFDRWVAEQAVSLAALTPEERGEMWYFEYGCDACHSLDGTDMVGPTWLGLFGSERPLTDGASPIADEDYLEQMIIRPAERNLVGYPAGVMPANFGERFEARQAEALEREGVEIDIVEDLIAFIKTLED